MDLQDTLTALRHLAESDPAVRDRLLASREAAGQTVDKPYFGI